MSVVNNIADFQKDSLNLGQLVMKTITTEEGVAIFINQAGNLVIYNLDGINYQINDAYPYLRLDTQFLGSFTTMDYLVPKYNSRGQIDNRHVIFYGPDSTYGGLRRLAVLVFDSPLTNLPHTS